MSNYNTVREAASHIDSYQLPELPEVEAEVIHDRLVAAERSIASPTLTEAGYQLGTAVYPNEIIDVPGSEPMLITAEHATDHWKIPVSGDHEPKKADWGTASLAYLLHQDVGASIIIPRGWQTGNANSQEKHVIKEAIDRWLRNVHGVGYTSLHGMKQGRLSSLTDEKAFDVAIGIGDDHSTETRKFAEKAVAIAKELGLRAGVNQNFIKLKDDKPVLVDGKPETFAFAASQPQRTRSFAHLQAQSTGQKMPMMQIELSGLLRLMPTDVEVDERSRIMGPYLGYKFMELLHKSLSQQ